MKFQFTFQGYIEGAYYKRFHFSTEARNEAEARAGVVADVAAAYDVEAPQVVVERVDLMDNE